MRDSIQIRPARPADAEVAAPLLYSAYIHTQIDYPLLEEPESGFIERLQQFFRQDGNRFSYQNILVAEQNAEVVGLVLSFGGRDEERLNSAAGNWLVREAEEDEWYIDALAVFKQWGRQGIGTLLLQSAEQLAGQHHYSRIALRVAEGNEPAMNLYTRQHYIAGQKTILYQRTYIRMQKSLDKQERGST